MTDRMRDGRPPFFMVYRSAYERICTHEPATIRPYMMMVYACLANHVNGRAEHEGSFPSYATMAKETGISRSSAIRGVKALEEAGLLSVTERQDAHGDRTSNLYVLTFTPEVVSDSNHPAEVVSDSDHGGSREELRVVSDSNPNKNDSIEKELMNQEEMWTQLRLLGIPDRPSYIRLVGRGPFDDPVETLEFARRKLAEKKRQA